MPTFHDVERTQAVSAAVLEVLREHHAPGSKIAQTVLSTEIAMAALNAVDRLPQTDHVDRDYVEQTLRATGDIPAAASPDLAAARTQAAVRTPAVQALQSSEGLEPMPTAMTAQMFDELPSRGRSLAEGALIAAGLPEEHASLNALALVLNALVRGQGHVDAPLWARYLHAQAVMSQVGELVDEASQPGVFPSTRERNLAQIASLVNDVVA